MLLLLQFDGFEEVSLPDVEEEEEPPKMPAASRTKKRKELGGHNNDKVSLGHLSAPPAWALSRCLLLGMSLWES